MVECLKCRDRTIEATPYEGEIPKIEPVEWERFDGKALVKQLDKETWVIGVVNADGGSPALCKVVKCKLTRYSDIEAETFDVVKVEGKTLVRFKNSRGNWEVSL